MRLGGRGWAPRKPGLRSQRWTERTTIDYYIKQNEIVSLLEGRKVINSEGPVIRENDITSAVCFGLQFKRKNWKRIWCGVKGVGLTAQGIGICCFFALPPPPCLGLCLSLGLRVSSQLLWHPPLPLQRRQCWEDTEVNSMPFCFWNLRGSPLSNPYPDSSWTLSLWENSRAFCQFLLLWGLQHKSICSRTRVGLVFIAE